MSIKEQDAVFLPLFLNDVSEPESGLLFLSFTAQVFYLSGHFFFLKPPKTSHKATQCIKLSSVADCFKLCGMLHLEES